MRITRGPYHRGSVEGSPISFGFARLVPPYDGPPLPDGIEPDMDQSEGLRARVTPRAIRLYSERVIGISPGRFQGLVDWMAVEALRAEGQNIARVELWLAYIEGVAIAQGVCGRVSMGTAVVVVGDEVIAVLGRPKVPRPASA